MKFYDESKNTAPGYITKANAPMSTRYCMACDAGAPRTRDGRHHPGWHGHRFATCWKAQSVGETP